MAEKRDGEAVDTEAPNASSRSAAQLPVPPMEFADFLQNTPPSQGRDIARSAFSEPKRNVHGREWIDLFFPEIHVHCDHEACGGIRIFRPADSELSITFDTWHWKYITYRCGNCKKTERTFSLALRFDQPNRGLAYKFGELPAFGPRTPARLISMIGPDRELFLKGRRSESHGLGIGAFGYYRRVVERQKDRIIGEIVKVAERLGVAAATIELLRTGQKETQFSKAVEAIKDAIPQALLINGRNPLNLLHTALSKGLHEQSDEVCLQLAQDIRIVLAELSERVAQALKDEAELNAAVSRLLSGDRTG